MGKVNNRWVSNTRCYVCDRWQPTVFICQPGTYPIPNQESTVKNPTFMGDHDFANAPAESKSISLGGSFTAFSGLLGQTAQMHDLSTYISLLRPKRNRALDGSTMSYASPAMRPPAVAKSNELIDELKRLPKLRSANIEPSFLELDKCGKDIWIATDWVKPGTRTEFIEFTMDYQSDNVEFSEAQHECFVPDVRREDVGVYVEPYVEKTEVVERVFDKEASVFKLWHEDTTASLKTSF
jgi:hypothetical protein